MSTENRLAALDQAVRAITPGGFSVQRAPELLVIAQQFYDWLEGPAQLDLTVDSVTYDQATPDGPGVPTRMKGNIVQLTDLQQVSLSVAEADSKGQPVSDALTWSVDNSDVVVITPSADGLSCLCVAGVEGSATVTVTDATVDPALTASEPFLVVGSAPTSLTISAGDVQDQAPAV